MFAIGWLERLLIASRAAWFYTAKLLSPANLMFSYPCWTINPASLLAYAWLVEAVGLVAAVLLARKHVGRSVEAVAEDYRPNFLCNYLYELGGRFTAFYENCPVLKSEAEQRASRLVPCDLTARVLRQGLDVLGIEMLEQM